jgi:two-component system CheB/CheR fusion protein
MIKQKKLKSFTSTKVFNNQATHSKSEKLEELPSALRISNSVSIIAIGASAGGLEALETMFEAITTAMPIAFIIITHLSPAHRSLLPELLQKKTKLKVSEITQNMQVEPNCIYVIPPKKMVVIKQGILKLTKSKTTTHISLPIDLFFQSLAQEQDRKIVAVVLSGTGMDGTQGIRALSTAGSLIIAQDPTTAEYNSMPNNAINTGLVDNVLPPEKILTFILKYLKNKLPSLPSNEKEIKNGLQPIFHLLHTHLGHDFSLYKNNTICRRIEKHMSIHQINDIAIYTNYLQRHPQEIQLLFKDLLIGVTSFFRDPEAFESLREILLQKLKIKPTGEEMRVWVPACATGEEAYSLAILLQECMEELHRYFSVQIFGTDINEAAIETARFGLYPLSIAADLSEQRLKRFFTKEEGRYRISKEIRKMVIFAPQNLTRDPPFTKLDILSCRNLLIYFTTILQKKLLPLFHYSLNYNGILFLGSAENVSGFLELFNVIEKKWKIFEHKEAASSLHIPISLETKLITEKALMHPPINHQTPKKTDIAHLVNNILLDNYAPVCIVLDEKENIVYIHGRTGKYLEPADGFVNLNILHMVRSELKPKISIALRNASLKKKQVSYSHLLIKNNDKSYYINLKIRPFRELNRDQYWKLLFIEEIKPLESFSKITHPKHISSNKLVQQISFLEKELKESKENLHTTIEELETSNEELKSSNEELQSTNEELQSTNEELETSKEELQSLNEELTTVNVELESHIEELSSANDDIQNLLYSTEIATIFLDNNLLIKRFTPKAIELTSLIQTDIGRPITDIVSKLKYYTLIEDARKVLETLHSKTIEVQDKEGQWFQVRIIPYRTLTNMIDGLVITFLNINVQKQAEEKLKQLNKIMQNAYNPILLLIDTLHEPLLVLDEKLIVISANNAFYKAFQTNAADVLEHSIYTVWETKAPNTQLLKLFEEKLKNTEQCNNFNIPYGNKKDNLKKMIINAQHIHNSQSSERQILLAITLENDEKDKSL